MVSLACVQIEVSIHCLNLDNLYSDCIAPFTAFQETKSAGQSVVWRRGRGRRDCRSIAGRGVAKSTHPQLRTNHSKRFASNSNGSERVRYTEEKYFPLPEQRQLNILRRPEYFKGTWGSLKMMMDNMAMRSAIFLEVAIITTASQNC